LEAKQKLVRQAARACAKAGLVNAYGHCSARLDDDSFLVCAAMPMGLITPRDDGVIVKTRGPLPAGVLGEVRAHQQIYARRPDVGGICRIMPPMLLSVSAFGRSPRVRHGFGAYFSPAAPFWNDTGLLRSDERAAELAAALGAARAILMRGNGAIVTGQTLEQAVVLSWYFEDAARVELDVLKASGGDGPLYSAEEAAARATFDGRIVERMWDYLTSGDPEGP
jgi:HCOMODA/2-hydroxy-3-carboxy-muconic semialdehyde decarboxylase